ncbi:hypothetical protein RFI_21093 [Reticulomyxa filosa]|uniref:Uncharacterized protein n=1 Tax=Reticulomyxa filosa TaxID=46433 RepID=X6MS22_RETFI|nr:hypothetical protein RFI_21093 [Reticulomyxa filosa]|eukprot:ETO16262.1 hypothetical protein RFI_21093 [Reticulomyxa filosa]
MISQMYQKIEANATALPDNESQFQYAQSKIMIISTETDIFKQLDSLTNKKEKIIRPKQKPFFFDFFFSLLFLDFTKKTKKSFYYLYFVNIFFVVSECLTMKLFSLKVVSFTFLLMKVLMVYTTHPVLLKER